MMHPLRLFGLLSLALLTSASVASGGGAEGNEGAGSADAPLTGKTWRLVALAGAEPESGATLRFEAEGTLNGYDGCNSFHSGFSVDGARIRIEPPIGMTMKACPDPVAARASAYIAALQRTASFAVEGDRLSLRDAEAVEVAGFELVPPKLTGTSWEVLAYNNGKQAVVSLIAGTRITASFGDDGQVTGTAGCNRYFAGYETDGESVEIGLAGATRRFCPAPEGVMGQESGYLTALHSAKTFRLEGERLTLRDAEGAIAVTLARADEEAEADSPKTSKIRFDLDRLDSRGLQGPPDGLRTLHYEYCIPDNPDEVRRVAAIDPTLEVQRGSPGRVGCGTGELLCLGNTHQPGYRRVLEGLAALAAVEEIREAVFE